VGKGIFNTEFLILDLTLISTKMDSSFSKSDAIEDYSRALDQDRMCRFSGVKGDLHHLPLRDLETVWAIDPPFPTIYQYYETGRRQRGYYHGQERELPEYAPFPDSNQEFSDRFYQAYPFMKGLNFSNILVAGGSICRLLRYQVNSSLNGNYQRYFQHDYNNGNNDGTFKGTGKVDLDVFFYGLNEDQAIAKIHQINDHLKKSGRDIRYTINQFTLNIFLRVRPGYYGGWQEVQLIFRLYTSISEILHGFDLGTSAVGFDGESVYFTSMAKFAYEYGCNVLDTTRRSTSYEWRLSKYLRRGFGLVLPQLNLPVILKIRASNLKDKKPSRHHDYYHDYYQDPHSVALPYAFIELREIKGNRIQGSFAPKYNQKYQIKASDYGQDHRTPTRPDIQNYEMNRRNCKFMMKGEYSKIRLMGTNFDDIINFRMDIDGMLEVFEYMNAEYLHRLQGFPETVATFQKEVEERKQGMKDKFLNESTKRKIAFITENPGRQLTSSINPIFEKEFEWYGVNFYIPPPDMRRDIIVNSMIGQKPAIRDLMTFYAKDENENENENENDNDS